MVSDLGYDLCHLWEPLGRTELSLVWEAPWKYWWLYSVLGHETELLALLPSHPPRGFLSLLSSS